MSNERKLQWRYKYKYKSDDWSEWRDLATAAEKLAPWLREWEAQAGPESRVTVTDTRQKTSWRLK